MDGINFFSAIEPSLEFVLLQDKTNYIARLALLQAAIAALGC